VLVEGNTFNQVSQRIANPITATHDQNTEAATWNIDASAYIPFGGRIRMVETALPQGNITNAANAVRYVQPNALAGQGAGGNIASLRWGEAVKGTVVARIRMDVPV